MIGFASVQLLIEVFAYFVAWSVLVVVILEVYAQCLMQVARLARVLKWILAFSIYLAVAVSLVLPLFGLGFDQEWHSRTRSGWEFVAFFLLCYLASAVPGAWLFRKRHLARLQRLGYFKPRR